MISQFFILNARGETLVSRDFRGDVVRGTAEIFFRRVKSARAGSTEPIFTMDGITFVFLTINSLYVLVTTKFNASPTLCIELLQRACSIFKDYCGRMDEDSVRKNFVLIYELLDEILDFGIPQDTSTEHLKAYIVNEAAPVVSSNNAIKKVSFGKKDKKTKTVSSKSTFKPLARQKSNADRNELFVDLFEKLTILFNADGEVLRSEIDGTLVMKSYLQGTPMLSMALNDDLVVGTSTDTPYGAVVVDDITFNEWVNTDEWENSRALSFQPPDGEFTVFNYRVSGDLRAPFRVFPFVEEVDDTRFEVVIKVRADFPQGSYANGFNLALNLPASTQSASVAVLSNHLGQDAGYKDGTLSWKVGRFFGGSELSIRATVALGANAPTSWRKEVGPIRLAFEIPMHNISNIQIRYLKLTERDPEYSPFRWVRYITSADSYVCRV